MSRIVIDNKSSADDATAIEVVRVIVTGGRVSGDGKSYRYAATFGTKFGKVSVYSNRTKSCDKFTVTSDPSKAV